VDFASNCCERAAYVSHSEGSGLGPHGNENAVAGVVKPSRAQTRREYVSSVACKGPVPGTGEVRELAQGSSGGETR